MSASLGKAAKKQRVLSHAARNVPPLSTRPSDACAASHTTNVTVGDAEGGDVLEGYGEQLSRAHTRLKDRQIADVWGSILAAAEGWDKGRC